MSKKPIFTHENMSFRLWLDSFPVSNYYPKVRQRILAVCEVSPQVFRNWRAGLSAISPLAKKEIVNIAEKNVFDVELSTNGHQYKIMYCEFKSTLNEVKNRMMHEVCEIMTEKCKCREDQCYSDYESLIKNYRETELLSELFIEYTVKKKCTKECNHRKFCLKEIKIRQNKCKSFIEDSKLLGIIIP